jgi:CopG family transcriptional regulator, nickel-responsive regulator
MRRMSPLPRAGEGRPRVGLRVAKEKEMAKKGVARIGVSLSPDLLEQFDRFIEAHGYETRSKAIGDLVRDRLTQQEWETGNEEVIGAVSLVYDHHVRDLSSRLTEMQHDHHREIITTSHIHIDAHKCLEILVLRGPASKIREIGDRLIGTRGVLHGKMIFTTTGKKL